MVMMMMMMMMVMMMMMMMMMMMKEYSKKAQGEVAEQQMELLHLMLLLGKTLRQSYWLNLI